MKAVVISDTHIPSRAKDIPKVIWEEIETADLIIHAGDFTTVDFYVQLKSVKPVRAVHGNMDEIELYHLLNEKEIFQLEGVRVGLTHGFGAPYGIEKRVLKMFEKDHVDLVIFGHSHIPLFKEVKGVKLLNPGTPTDTIYARRQSYAVLHIQDSSITAEIKYL